MSILLALALASQPADDAQPAIGDLPRLSLAQSTALRCGVVFATAARMQADGDPAAAAWPPLASRGKEYFVRVFARLMDDTGASRETLNGMAMREADGLRASGGVAQAMPACLPLLDAAGIK
jgi:hypothetical protein